MGMGANRRHGGASAPQSGTRKTRTEANGSGRIEASARAGRVGRFSGFSWLNLTAPAALAALAASEDRVPHLPSIQRWRDGDRKQPYDPNVDASRQEMRSFACAQCHDHKLDAVAQRDYYALAGLFMSTRWSVRSVETSDPNVATIDELRRIKADIRSEMAKWENAVRTTKM